MKPWEPQKGESIPAFQAFAEYRDMGDSRSIEAVARSLAKSRTLIGRWSARWKWTERLQAFVAYMAEIEQRGRERGDGRGASPRRGGLGVRAPATGTVSGFEL